MAEAKPTAHELNLGRETNLAMERYAVRHSASLVLFTSDTRVELGSATCIAIGGKYFLATAGHNLESVDNEAIRIVANQTTSDRWMPILGKNWVKEAGIDVGWVEIETDAARKSKLTFLQIESLGTFEKPCLRSLYLIQGLPAELSNVKERKISLASLGFMTIPAEPDGVSYDYNPDVEIILEYSDSDYPLPIPKGMSGGGVWAIPNDLEPLVWSPEKSRLVGIVKTWREKSKHLAAVKIEHWLELVGSDFPELAKEVDRALVASSD